MRDNEFDWKRWLNGLILPIAFTAFGISGLVRHRLPLTDSFRLDYTQFDLSGHPAIAGSIGFIALAVMLHTFFFWENDDRFERIRLYVTVGSAICLAGSVLWCVVASAFHI